MNDLEARLSAPFAAHEVKFKPAVVSGNRALALAYVDSRCIMQRLDDVLGVANWQDSYEFLPDGSVICTLKVRINDEWIVKQDVGGQSEQADEGDRKKAAVSDALKRAAVKYGVGRYLYRLSSQWVDWNPERKQFVKTPTLPHVQQPFETALKAVSEAADLQTLAKYRTAYQQRGYTKLQLQLLDAAHDRLRVELTTKQAG